MIPNAKPREVRSHGLGASAAFGISLADSAHIMNILRDTLYSDKVLAVLREYSSNAWDAHRSVGKNDLPIKVEIPTYVDPTLTIRDFGPGLSQEEVFTIYTQYGASTKRGNDNSVGMLGIGCKSGFAYSDSFTIVSHYEGVKSTYVAVLDKNVEGSDAHIDLLHEEPCGDQTGVLIKIAVQQRDVGEFNEKAKKLFKYFIPRPDINVDLPQPPTTKASLVHGAIYETDPDDYHGSKSKWVAIMGCIPYTINLEQLALPENTYNEEGEVQGIASFLQDLSGALFFKIGDVQIAADREKLKYTDDTKKALVAKFNALVDEFVTTSLTEIATSTFTPWEKRIRALVLAKMHIPVPDVYKPWMQGHFAFDEEKFTKSFRITRNGNQTFRLNIMEEARILLRDDARPLPGYDIKNFDYIITKGEDKDTPWDDIKKEIDQLFYTSNLTGIPIIHMSTMAWAPPQKKTGPTKKVDVKHRRKRFIFKPSNGWHYGSPWSQYWTISKDEPVVEDVYVMINKFKVSDFQFYGLYKSVAHLAEAFSKPLPKIFGYKSTEKKPMKMDGLIGKPFKEWKDEFAKSLLTPDVKALLANWSWSHVFNERYGWNNKGIHANLIKALGANHIITEMFEKHWAAKQALEKAYKNNSKLQEALEILYVQFKDDLGVLDSDTALKAVTEKYDLFNYSHIARIDSLWGSESEVWVNYVIAIDS